jgi:hypothetical protein
MPDPLMGFALQSFTPPVQPFAVSGAVALLMLERLPFHPRPGSLSREPKFRAKTTAPHVGGPSERPSPSGLCSTRESATSRRRVRPARARGSPGIPPLQGVPPRRAGNGLHRASPHEIPAWATNRPPGPSTGFCYPTRLACLSRDCRPSWGLPPRDLATEVQVGRGSGVASSSPGVRCRPLGELSWNRRSYLAAAFRGLPFGGS